MRRQLVALAWAGLAISAEGRPLVFGSEVVIDSALGTASSVITADVNRDGHLDVIGTGFGSGAGTKWYAGDGNGGFGPGQLIDAGGQANNVSTGDVDRDGDLDVAIATSESRLVWYANNGSGTFTIKQVLDNAGNIADVELVDVNNDGRLDIAYSRQLISGGLPQGVYWFENSGATFNTTRRTVGPTNYTGEISSADMNRDGFADIIL